MEKLAREIVDKFCEADPEFNRVSAGLLVALTEAHEKAVQEAREDQKEKDCVAIVAACRACDGRGGIEIPTPDGMDHGCNGDEKLCSRICPIPVQMPPEVQQCEYCGRPCDAIRSLRSVESPR